MFCSERMLIKPRRRSCVITPASGSWRGASWSHDRSLGPASGTSVSPPTHLIAQWASASSYNLRWVPQISQIQYLRCLVWCVSTEVPSLPAAISLYRNIVIFFPQTFYYFNNIPRQVSLEQDDCQMYCTTNANETTLLDTYCAFTTDTGFVVLARTVFYAYNSKTCYWNWYHESLILLESGKDTFQNTSDSS